VFRHLKIEQHGDVALVRIDRPPANALDLELLEEGSQAVDELATASPGAVVITGRNGFFSAGVDLKLAPTLDEAAQRGMVDGINRLFAGWYAFPRPVVCAVNGHAIAGGLILALCGDDRIGAREGKLGLTEVTAGIPYPRAAIAIVRAELSAAAARRLVLGGELVGPEAALELGLVDELQEGQDVVARALELAAKRAALPREAYARIKHQLRGETIAAARAAVEHGADPVSGGWLGAETAQASAAILDRRRA
jgi:enoyl-CoA hydratase